MANCRVCHERPAEIGLRCRPCHNAARIERRDHPLPRTCAVCGKPREKDQVKYCVACAPAAMAAVRVAYETKKLAREKEERRARGKIRPGRKVQPAGTDGAPRPQTSRSKASEEAKARRRALYADMKARRAAKKSEPLPPLTAAEKARILATCCKTCSCGRELYVPSRGRLAVWMGETYSQIRAACFCGASY